MLLYLNRPKRGHGDFLHEYINAEIKGREGRDCDLVYDKCPFSVARFIKSLNKDYNVSCFSLIFLNSSLNFTFSY